MVQFKEAGLSVDAPDDVISDDDQMKLLSHLRNRHGKAEPGDGQSAPKRVTLERRKVIEIKQASVPGSSTKTISVEVRKKRTYVNVKHKDEQETGLKEQLAILDPAHAPEPPQPQEPELRKEEPVIESPAPEVPVETVSEEVLAEPVMKENAPAEAQPAETRTETEQEEAAQADKKIKPEKSVKQQKELDEKERRLEESIKRNAERVRQQAAGKKETLHRNKFDEEGRSINLDAFARAKRRVRLHHAPRFYLKESINSRCRLLQ